MATSKQQARNLKYWQELDARTCTRCGKPELVTLAAQGTGAQSIVCMGCDVEPVKLDAAAGYRDGSGRRRWTTDATNPFDK